MFARAAARAARRGWSAASVPGAPSRVEAASASDATFSGVRAARWTFAATMATVPLAVEAGGAQWVECALLEGGGAFEVRSGGGEAAAAVHCSGQWAAVDTAAWRPLGLAAARERCSDASIGGGVAQPEECVPEDVKAWAARVAAEARAVQTQADREKQEAVKVKAGGGREEKLASEMSPEEIKAWAARIAAEARGEK